MLAEEKLPVGACAALAILPERLNFYDSQGVYMTSEVEL